MILQIKIYLGKIDFSHQISLANLVGLILDINWRLDYEDIQ